MNDECVRCGKMLDVILYADDGQGRGIRSWPYCNDCFYIVCN